jgi:hypothetical protein
MCWIAKSENAWNHIDRNFVFALMGALPQWQHSRSRDYYPSSGLGVVLNIIVILMVLGRI